jgi:putative peptide zinc metalloprotease protein
MGTSVFSASWYRVAHLKPKLRQHAAIHRHVYRAELWYVLEDRITGRYQRFTPSAYAMIGLMDGKLTVEELWQVARKQLGESAPTQDEVIRLLSQLHAENLLQSDVSPDTIELLERFEKRRNVKLKQNIRNPMAMRFTLFDPEPLLVKLAPLVRPLFSWFGALLWLVVVVTGCALAGLNWQELTRDITDRVLAPGNLVILWFVYPVLKAMHEFGHALTVKRLGGEVHEMGIMFLVLTPIPYVDASAASALPSKWKRTLVGAAGLGVELFVAAVCLFIWTSVEPGAFRSVMYNVVILAGVSSLFFNGNPLLRYDAYYMLSDLLEIPNLASRGMHYVGYLIQRYPFGIRDAEPPVSTPGERFWFVTYSILSFSYRIFIYVAIIQFIAGKFFFIGVMLAIWAGASMIIFPLAKASKFLFASPRLGTKRARAIVLSVVAVACAGAAISLVPFPLSTVSEGVFWFPDDTFVRAQVDGFVERLLVNPGTPVKSGDALIECDDPLLPARVRVLEAQVLELEASYDSQFKTKQVEAELTARQLARAREELTDARRRSKDLTLHSLTSGVFVSLLARDLVGKFAKRGETLGYVLDKSAITARVAVPQSSVDLVRNRTHKVDVRLPEKLWETVPAAMLREVPAATDQLPSKVLSQQGGGKIAIDPTDPRGTKAFQKYFFFDIRLPASTRILSVGGRVYARIDHGWEPLVYRWYRGIRELLLKRFNI